MHRRAGPRTIWLPPLTARKHHQKLGGACSSTRTLLSTKVYQALWTAVHLIAVAGATLVSCPSNCKDCGASLKSCGREDGGACSPFRIQPNVDDQQCASWRDSGRFETSNFFQYSRVDSYQAWQADGTSGTWVVHGCDGSGVQTDCRGDVLYLEHFNKPQKSLAPPCPAPPYPNNEPCPGFSHPGQPQGHLSFGEYECGWWRGYKSPGDADLPKAAADAGLFGPAGAGGDYSQKLQKVLSNCPTCNGGTALVNPYTDAKAYFTGGLWPWVCSTSGGAAMKDYTGKASL